MVGEAYQTVDIDVRHVPHCFLRLFDVFLGREVVVVSAERHQVRVARGRGAVRDGVQQFVVRVRHAGPRAQLRVAHFGMDFGALVHVASVRGRTFARRQRRRERDRVEDVERDGRDQARGGEGPAVAGGDAHAGGFVVVDAGDGAGEGVGEVAGGEGFVEKLDRKARLAAAELVLDQVLDAVLVGVVAERPPVQELVEAAVLGRAAAAEQDEGEQGCALVGREVMFNLLDAVGDGEVVEGCCFRVVELVVRLGHDFLAVVAVDVDEFEERGFHEFVLVCRVSFRDRCLFVEMLSLTSSSWLISRFPVAEPKAKQFTPCEKS